jgi:hypothetical protein
MDQQMPPKQYKFLLKYKALRKLVSEGSQFDNRFNTQLRKKISVRASLVMKALVSNRSHKIRYFDQGGGFPQTLQENVRMVFRIGENRILLNSVQVPLNHLMQKNLRA